MRATLRVKAVLATVAVGAVIGLVLVASTYAVQNGGLTPMFCSSTLVVSNESMWTPLSLVNSPYGGLAYANATVPAGLFSAGNSDFPPSLTIQPVPNGSIWAGLWKVNVSVFEHSSSAVDSVGATRGLCASQFSAVVLSEVPGHLYTGPIFRFWWEPLFGPNSTTDQGEPNTYNYSVQPGDSSVRFSNGYSSSNSPTVSTCGTAGKWLGAASDSFQVELPFTVDGTNRSEAYTLPIVQSFNYWFPADFGTWQVDNLSAPGGPGGGWAFSYVGPCA